MRQIFWNALLFGLAVAPATWLPAEKKPVTTLGADSSLPFSPGIHAGDFLYVSGHLGLDPDTGRAGGDAGSQTAQALRNLEAVLQAADMTLADVVNSNVYLSDIRNFGDMNQTYRASFGNNPPPRTTVEVDLPAAGALVEISLVAARRGMQTRRISPPGWPSPQSPYSWGMLAGDTLYAAGMVSEDPATGRLIGGDAESQTGRALENLGAVLKSAGLSYRDVTSCRVYLADPRDFESMNRTFRRYFSESPPARATVRARLAFPELKVEIQCVAVGGSDRRIIGTATPGRPFSPAIWAGGRIYLSGMVGRGPGGFARGNVEAQTRQTLENLRETLRAAGADFDDVVESVVFLTDIRQFGEMNEVYRAVVSQPFPARTTVGAPLMSPEALVEIMMVAAAP